MNSLKGSILVVAMLVIVNVHPMGVASGQSRKRAKQPAKVTQVVLPSENVSGNGETSEKARATAKKNAVDRVEALLQERFARGGWQPTDRDLDPAYLEQMKVIQPVGEPEEGPGVVGPVNFTATYRVELTSQYLVELVREARHQKVQERHLLLARVLSGILAITLVTAGYLRLEEMTRGYATKLLRLAAVVILAIVGAGLLLIK